MLTTLVARVEELTEMQKAMTAKMDNFMAMLQIIYADKLTQ